MCLALPDLILAKLEAGRPHDLAFVDAAIEAKLVTVDELRLGIDLMPEESRSDVARRLEGIGAKATIRAIQAKSNLSEDEAMRLALEAQQEARRDADPAS